MSDVTTAADQPTTMDQIAAAIRPKLPIDWEIAPFSDEPSTLTRTTVMIEATNIDPGTTAGTYAIEHHVYVLTPKGSTAQSVSDATQDAVLLTLHALLKLRGVLQGSAARLTFPGGYPCWDITVQIEAVVTDDTDTEG